MQLCLPDIFNPYFCLTAFCVLNHNSSSEIFRFIYRILLKSSKNIFQKIGIPIYSKHLTSLRTTSMSIFGWMIYNEIAIKHIGTTVLVTFLSTAENNPLRCQIYLHMLPQRNSWQISQSSGTCQSTKNTWKIIFARKTIGISWLIGNDLRNKSKIQILEIRIQVIYYCHMVFVRSIWYINKPKQYFFQFSGEQILICER